MQKDLWDEFHDIIEDKEGIYGGGFEQYYRGIISEATNLCNPAHNLVHFAEVTIAGNDAVKFYCNDLTTPQRRTLIIANLGHDFDHWGAINDYANIQKAIRWLDANISSRDRLILNDTKDLVFSTEFPYRHSTKPLSQLEQIMRDADRLQTFRPTWYQFVVGLAKEKGISVIEMLRREIPYLNGLEFYTTWAQGKVSKETIEAKKKEVQRITMILENDTGM